MNISVNFQENNSIWNNNKKVVGYSFFGMSVLAFFYAVKKHYNRIKVLNKNTLGIAEKNPEIEESEKNKSENIEDDKDDLEMEEKIQKIVEKIKNNIIHTTIICIDRLQKKGATNSTSKSFDKKEDNNEDIVIEETQIISDDTAESNFNLLNHEVDDFLPEFEKKIYSMPTRKSNDTMNSKYYFKFFKKIHF
jgi:hypothetical protein